MRAKEPWGQTLQGHSADKSAPGFKIAAREYACREAIRLGEHEARTAKLLQAPRARPKIGETWDKEPPPLLEALERPGWLHPKDQGGCTPTTMVFHDQPPWWFTGNHPGGSRATTLVVHEQPPWSFTRLHHDHSPPHL